MVHLDKRKDIGYIAISRNKDDFFGSERDLFRKLPVSLLSKIERSVCNRRKRGLFYHRDNFERLWLAVSVIKIITL